jgi:hypothetical protein
MTTLLRSLAGGILLTAAFFSTNQALAQCAFGGTYWANATPSACPGTNTQTCVWGGEYVLVNVVAGNTYTFSTCGGAAWDTQITVFNNANGTVVGYNDDACGLQSTVTWTATFTGTVRVLLSQYNCNANTSCATLTINCAAGATPPPVCGSTVYDTGGPTGNYANNQNYAVTYCPTNPGEVVTLNFTQFATEGCCDFVTIYNGNSTSSPVMGTFSGTGLPGSFTSTHPSGCITLQFTSDGSITAAGWAATISCAPPPPPPSGDCVYVLTLTDSFGDGWGSSSVGVSINGGPYTWYTVTNFINTVLIGVNIGDVIALNYNNSGAWQGENAYSLGLQGGGTYYNSGSPPPAGVQYVGVVDCVSPPAPPEDCIGSITLCSNQGFNNNTNNTGNVEDLTTFTAGCLANNERQGTWYNFSPSESGTLAFTISPANPADDYDFAIWGPYPPGSTIDAICPPSSPPLRCSYAAPSGDTGLSFTATDLSEGAFGDKWVRYLDVLEGQVYLLYVSNWSQSGLAFNLNFNPASTASLDCTILPVELLGLHAQPQQRTVDLRWTTLTEFNSERFLVERASDDLRFEVIGELAAQGHSLAPTDYHFTDQSPLHGVNYYRLTQLDLDGSAARSNTVTALFTGNTHAAMVLPNPTGGTAELLLAQVPEGPFILHLRDARGRLVQSQQLNGGNGAQRFALDLHRLDGGMYSISLHDMHGAPLGNTLFVKE